MKCWLVFAGVVALAGAACVSEAPEAEELATLDVELSPVEGGVQASFTAVVPDGADNVEIWFGDGQIVQDSLAPVHMYRVNAPYQASLFYDDPSGGGRVNAEVVVEDLPVPLDALALPDGPGAYLIAVNHYSFLHNYERNEPAHTWLRQSEAIAFRVDEDGVSLPVDDAVIDFFPSREASEGRSVSLASEATRAWADLGDEPHVLIPGWTVGGERIVDGGFTMPLVSRTEAPEPDVPHSLVNADFPIDQELTLRMRLPVGGGAHGLVYTLIGPDGSTQVIVDDPTGNAPVRISPEELAQVGPGVVGLFTALYSEAESGGMVIRNNSVGYAPIWLMAAGE